MSTPRSIASWMVAMLSASSLSPYQLPAPIPMHPRAIGNTEGPRVPSLPLFVAVMSRTLRSDFEVAPALEIGDETRLVWVPSKPLSRHRARGRKVEREETREPGEVRGGLFGGLRDDRHVQASADDLRDLPGRHALVGNAEKRRSRRTLLERQPEEMRGIEPVHRGPPVAPVADVGRDALLARDLDEDRNEAVIAIAMHRGRQARQRRADAARRQRERGTFRGQAVRNGGAGIGRIVLCTDAAVCEDADSGRDDEGSSGSRERRADGLDREPARVAGGREVREAVDERGVDEAIRCSRAALQAGVIVGSTTMRPGT